MRIDSSTIGMESARSYSKTSATVNRFVIRDYQEDLTQGNNALHAAIGGSAGEMYETENSESQGTGQEQTDAGGNTVSLQEWQGRLQIKVSNVSLRNSADQTVMDIRQATVRYIFDLLFRARREAFYGRERLREEVSQESVSATQEGFEEQFSTLNQVVTGNAMNAQRLTANLRVLSYQRQTVETELEETSFSTVGTVKTADGREINFNVNVGMSRAFQKQYSEELNWTAFSLCDPLVINLDTDVAELSDQNFYFDIDGDGEKDEVSQLAGGSGYLALDKNGDGMVNDGKELFGTTSGNGFADLAEYDDDGNGWIDEGDAIWDKLQIWCKDENGKDILYKLADKGVGAICLQNVATDYTLQDAVGQTRGVIRNSGVFLYENGNVGTIQHVDVAKFYA